VLPSPIEFLQELGSPAHAGEALRAASEVP
jgi:hypothetical protein